MDFIFAKVTNSRLMGSIGLLIAWKDKEDRLDQYFLLDAEGLGIADYVGIKNEKEAVLKREEERLMGGLGAERIFISKEEALFLVYHFGNKTLSYHKKLPGNIKEYFFMLEKKVEKSCPKNIFSKICKTIETPIEFVQYMIMRFIARDKEALEFFSLNKEIGKMHITHINGVLLQNKITRLDENRYSCQCIFEDKEEYYKAKIGIQIVFLEEGYKIRSFILGNKKKVDPLYVLKELKRPEYIGIYKVKNAKRFIEKFHKDNPYCMRSNFEKGSLFTQFNKNNDHVKEETYLISEDIYSIYYINEKNQLIVANYSEKDRLMVDEILYTKYEKEIDLEKEYVFQGSLIYEFAEKGYEDFYDFIKS